MITPTQVVASGACALSVVGGVLWYASAWPESQLFGAAMIAGNDPNQIAITFDDGPNDAATPEILDILARYNTRATFFAIGEYVRTQPALARRIIDEGHVLANHTMHHPKLSTKPVAVIRQELQECNAAIEDVTGTAVRFFRPPFGARRPVVLKIARELSLVPVFWNITCFDWKTIGVEGIMDNIEFGITRNQRRKRSSTILLHDGGHLWMGTERFDTIKAVDRLLATHQNEQFVTVDAWDTPKAQA